MFRLIMSGFVLAFALGLLLSIPPTFLVQPPAAWKQVIVLLAGPLATESIYICLIGCFALVKICLCACLNEVDRNFEQMIFFLGSSHEFILRHLSEDPEIPVQRPFSEVKIGPSDPVMSMAVPVPQKRSPPLEDMSHLYPLTF